MHHVSVTATASAVFHILLLYCGFCIACANAAQPPQQSLALAFENTSCADALKRAASEQKYLLVLFSGEWVEEEAQVKDTVLQDKQVARTTAGRVIAVRADAVRDTELMQQFQIRALPTLLLLNAGGDELARWTGVPKAGALAKDLSAVLENGLPLAKINAPGEAGSYRKNFNAAVEFQKTGAYEAALKQYQLAYEKLNSSRGKVSIAIINAEEVVWLVAAMREVLPEADAMLRDYLEKYRARIAKDPNAEQAANCAFEIYRAIAGRDAALSLYQQTPPGKVREKLKWDAFAIFAHKQDYAQAVALTTPDEALMLVKGKADASMFRLRKAIYGYFEVRNNPRLERVRSDRHLVVVDEFAKTLIFEAYAGADDERTSREVALVILGKKPKPEHISLLHAALRRARPGDAAQFAQRIGLPPAPPAPSTASAPAPVSRPPPAAEATSAQHAGPKQDSRQNSKQEPVDTASIVGMSEFVVSAKPFAAIPMNGRIRRGRWGMKIIKTPASVFPYTGGPSLESSGLKPGDRIVAVNGKAVPGASFNEFREMWLYGEIGESVKLIVQGSGKDESVFREVTVKRIRYPILPQTNGTRTPGDVTTATGAQDSSAP